MNWPLPGRGDSDRTADEEFERLRPSLSVQLDRWPDFVRPPRSSLHDVLPQADLEETDDSYLVDVELPGVSRDAVSVEVAQRRLVVTGERRQRLRTGLLRHSTRTTGSFRLAVTLPNDVDGDRVTAALEHGVLSIHVPKAESARRRRIPVTFRRDG